VLVGGMAIGTLFTLFVIPSIYMLIARDHAKDRSRQSLAKAAAATDGPGAEPDAAPQAR